MPPIIETRQLHHLYSAGTPFEHPALNGVDFSAQAGPGNALPRSALYLSAGTLDQLYLALRLAICQLTLPGIPLVLDDALANFDDGRCALALEALARLGEERQILLFTCHSREGEFFAGDREVFVQRLTDAAVEV